MAPSKTSSKTINYDTLKKDTQLIPVTEVDTDRIVIKDPIPTKVPGGGTAFRAKVFYHYEDNSFGPFIYGLSRKYCYGVQADNIDMDGNVVLDDKGAPKPLRNYKAPLVMLSKSSLKAENERSSEEQEIYEQEMAEIDSIDMIEAHFREWCGKNRAKFGAARKSEASAAENVSEILFRKKDKMTGEIIQPENPKFYCNLKYFANKNECQTVFYGPGDKIVDPLKQTEAHFSTPSIHVDSIYFGNKYSAQSRMYDSTIEPRSFGPQKRLAPTNTLPSTSDDSDQNLDESDDEE